MHVCIWGNNLSITDKDDCGMQIPGFDHFQSLADTCTEHLRKSSFYHV